MTTTKRKILAEKLKLESHLVREESMTVLREFELAEDNNSLKNQ
jgi:hypothetical protein